MPKHRILVIEDEQAIRDSMADLLDIAGYEFDLAENGIQGLSKVVKFKPDIVICDIMMPELDGYGFVQRLKSDERYETLPVIFLSALVDLDSRIKGLELGVDDYITKPFEFRELRLKVRNLLNNRDLLRKKIQIDPDFNSDDDRFVKKLNSMIELRISEKINLETISFDLNMSVSTFKRKVKSATGNSASRYLMDYRLARAQEMIDCGYSSVKEIAEECGFGSASYFSTVYKEKYNRTPKQAITNS